MPPRKKVPAPAPVARLSAGVWADLQMHGRATDPVTGKTFVKDKVTGDITEAK